LRLYYLLPKENPTPKTPKTPESSVVYERMSATHANNIVALIQSMPNKAIIEIEERLTLYRRHVSLPPVK